MISISKADDVKLNNTEICFNNNSYIVKDDNHILGHFSVIKREDSVILDYELLKDYQNKGLGNYFLQIIDDYLNENFDFNRILLFIKYDNIRSKKVALKNNYELSNFMDISSEMSMFDLYSKNREKVKQYVDFKVK